MLRCENSKATTNKVEERALLEAKLSGLQNLDMDASLSQSLAEVKQGDYSRLSDPDLVSCLQEAEVSFQKKMEAERQRQSEIMATWRAKMRNEMEAVQKLEEKKAVLSSLRAKNRHIQAKLAAKRRKRKAKLDRRVALSTEDSLESTMDSLDSFSFSDSEKDTTKSLSKTRHFNAPRRRNFSENIAASLI